MEGMVGVLLARFKQQCRQVAQDRPYLSWKAFPGAFLEVAPRRNKWLIYLAHRFCEFPPTYCQNSVLRILLNLSDKCDQNIALPMQINDQSRD
jgi:hypothetical protein